MAAPNIVGVTSIFGKTTGSFLGTTLTTSILTCATNKVLKINSIIVANVDGTNEADVTVNWYDSGSLSRYSLASTVPVPADSTLVVLSKDTSIYLEEGDRIEAGASATGDLHIIVSYEEIDDA
jgi:hypothetical protein